MTILTLEVAALTDEEGNTQEQGRGAKQNNWVTPRLSMDISERKFWEFSHRVF